MHQKEACEGVGQTPIKARWLVPLLKVAVISRPGMSNKAMIELLKPYVIDWFLTQLLFQQTRSGIHICPKPSAMEDEVLVLCVVNKVPNDIEKKKL